MTPTSPALEVMVTTDEDDNVLVVLMEKLSGAQIAMSDRVFREMVTLVGQALGGEEIEDVPDETVIRLH